MSTQTAWPLLGTSRGLAGLLTCTSSHTASLQCQSIAAFSAQAAAKVSVRGQEQASTSGRDSAPADKSAPRGRGAGKKAGPAAGAAPTVSAAALAAASSHTTPSRLALFARTVLHRELQLKLGPRAWDAVPRLTSITASIRASETKLERDIVDKWELLLHSLALETLTGRPATFISPPNKHLATRSAGLSVTLDALSDPDTTYNFLEKLVHIILPNQVGFEGVAPPTLVPKKFRSEKEAFIAAQRAAADHRPAPPRPFATQLRVNSLLQYPDFEQNFALFEPLSGMRVRLEIEGVRAEDCSALLTGLSVPVLTGAAAEAALAEAEAEALAEARKSSRKG